LAGASQAAHVALPWVPLRSCIVDPFGPTGLLFLAFGGATLASVALGALGGLLWLRAGLRGSWDVYLAAASAFNALPLVYVALGYLGVRW
jgi:hypothetical protein